MRELGAESEEDMFGKLLKIIKHRHEVRMALSSALRIAEGDANAMILGGLSDVEIAGLISWLPECGTFVEFGTLFGLTAKAIAAAKPNLKIIAVDNFSWNPFGLPPALHEAFTRKILANEIASGQVDVLNMTSEEFRVTSIHNSSFKVPNSIDAVFFDALHQYEPVKAEIEWAKSLGVKIIAGHDYNNPSPVFGVTRAVNESFPHGVETVGMCWRAK